MNTKSPDSQVRRRRVAKGRRPFFFSNSETDKLLAVIAALTGELAVVRQRLDTHERIAAQRGLFSKADIETYEPDLETTDERAMWRQEYLQRVFRILEMEHTQPDISQAERAYVEMIETFARPTERSTHAQSKSQQPLQRDDTAQGQTPIVPLKPDR